MSGFFYSSGLLTNNGSKDLKIEDYLNRKIEDIAIHVIPLSTNEHFTTFQTVGAVLKTFTPMVFNPSLTHVAIQLNLENTKDVFIIEYGEYWTKDSNPKKSIFSSSSSSKEPRENKNDNIYYYINKDGARLTLFTFEKLKKAKEYLYNRAKVISKLIACQYYNITMEELNIKESKSYIMIFNFHNIECDIKNKITLNELINNFKGEKWEAKKYNVLTHNCQTFSAEIIKILKAIRISIKDKVRAQEKAVLPGCLINALWHNEDWSLTNTLGRIPIFGLFHDFYCAEKYHL